MTGGTGFGVLMVLLSIVFLASSTSQLRRPLPFAWRATLCCGGRGPLRVRLLVAMAGRADTSACSLKTSSLCGTPCLGGLPFLRRGLKCGFASFRKAMVALVLWPLPRSLGGWVRPVWCSSWVNGYASFPRKALVQSSHRRCTCSVAVVLWRDAKLT